MVTDSSDYLNFTWIQTIKHWLPINYSVRTEFLFDRCRQSLNDPKI